MVTKSINICIVCSKRLTGKQKRYCSSKCANMVNQNYIAQQNRGALRKIRLVNLLGGKCCICGYDKNLAALIFHHEDCKAKEFPLTLRELSNNKLDKLLKELRKCKLFCMNCHQEVHNPRFNNWQLFEPQGDKMSLVRFCICSCGRVSVQEVTEDAICYKCGPPSEKIDIDWYNLDADELTEDMQNAIEAINKIQDKEEKPKESD